MSWRTSFETLDPAEQAKFLKDISRISRGGASSANSLKIIRSYFGAKTLTSLRILVMQSFSGDLALALKKQVDRQKLNWSVEGCESNVMALAYSRRKAKDLERGVFFFQMDLEAYQIPEKYDVVMVDQLFFWDEVMMRKLILMIQRSSAKLVIFQLSKANSRLEKLLFNFFAQNSKTKAIYRANQGDASVQLQEGVKETAWREISKQTYGPGRVLEVYENRKTRDL